jgi:hypothetical protein
MALGGLPYPPPCLARPRTSHRPLSPRPPSTLRLLPGGEPLGSSRLPGSRPCGGASFSPRTCRSFRLSPTRLPGGALRRGLRLCRTQHARGSTHPPPLLSQAEPLAWLEALLGTPGVIVAEAPPHSNAPNAPPDSNASNATQRQSPPIPRLPTALLSLPSVWRCRNTSTPAPAGQHAGDAGEAPPTLHQRQRRWRRQPRRTRNGDAGRTP